VSAAGRWMGVLDGSGDRRRERGSFAVNVEHPIVTNGDLICGVVILCHILLHAVL